MIDLEGVLADVGRGLIPAHIYNDQEIFALERDRLFSRAWVFIAHESEIPVDLPQRRSARGLPFHAEAYGGEDGFAREGQTLLPAPSLDSYNGLIFISLREDAPPLRDWLGDFAFYLDLYTRQSPDGIELRGPQRWRVKANWKIGAENFAGDSYHTPHTHASVVDIGLFREPKASKRKEGALYMAGPGAGTTYKLPPGGSLPEQLRYVGYPDQMIAAMDATWSADQHKLIEDAGFMVSAATLFPSSPTGPT